MITNHTPYEALMSCHDKAGSKSALARDLGISSTAVWKWFQSTKRMPAEHVLKAESIYGVSRHVLRPDIYPRNHPPAPDTRLASAPRIYGVDHDALRVSS